MDCKWCRQIKQPLLYRFGGLLSRTAARPAPWTWCVLKPEVIFAAHVEAGGLMSYRSDYSSTYRHVAGTEL